MKYEYRGKQYASVITRKYINKWKYWLIPIENIILENHNKYDIEVHKLFDNQQTSRFSKRWNGKQTVFNMYFYFFIAESKNALYNDKCKKSLLALIQQASCHHRTVFVERDGFSNNKLFSLRSKTICRSSWRHCPLLCVPDGSTTKVFIW